MTEPNAAIWTVAGATVTAIGGVALAWIRNRFTTENQKRERLADFQTETLRRLEVQLEAETRRREDLASTVFELRRKHAEEMDALRTAYQAEIEDWRKRYRALGDEHDDLKRRLRDVEEEKADLATANVQLTRQVHEAARRADDAFELALKLQRQQGGHDQAPGHG